MLIRIKEEKLTELSSRLREKEDEGRVAESDFARIQSEITSIKVHLKGEIEQLNR